MHLIAQEFAVGLNEIGKIDFPALIIRRSDFQSLFGFGNESIAEQFKLFGGCISISDLPSKLTSQAIAFGFPEMNGAVSVVCSFTHPAVDSISPYRQTHTDREVDIIMPIGNRADNVLVITDDRIANSKLEVRILLQTRQFLLCTITSDLSSKALQFGIALLGFDNQ